MPRHLSPASIMLCFRRSVFFAFTLGIVATANVPYCHAQSKPNVLLICVDDLKPAIGCFGDAVAKTPHMDSLAKRGVRFYSAYCNQAVCAPSRNALMTGLRPQTLGVYDLETHFRKAAPEAVTFSQHFMRNGYVAHSLGKIYHVGQGNYDDKASWTTASWHPRKPDYVLKGSLDRISRGNKKNGRKRGPATESANVSDDNYADSAVADEAIKRLRSLSESVDQPFFLAVGFMKPHLPFVAPQKYWDLYDSNELPMPRRKRPPEGAPSFAATGFGELRSYSDMPAKGAIDEPTARRLIHGYYAAASYMDSQLGRVLKEVETSGLFENTVVILWGDHGWHLGDHGMWCKHTNYEQAVHVPLIVASPSGQKDQVSMAMVETVDVFPTIAELAGLPVPENVDGRSFAKVIADPSLSARPYVTHVYPRGQQIGRAIRDSRYRMVQWKVPGKRDESAEIELYDYQDDPQENVNLASAKPQIVKSMLELLAEHPEAKKQYRDK